jgi:hypothetical protein
MDGHLGVITPHRHEAKVFPSKTNAGRFAKKNLRPVYVELEEIE